MSESEYQRNVERLTKSLAQPLIPLMTFLIDAH
jgi:hypothetical protein